MTPTSSTSRGFGLLAAALCAATIPFASAISEPASWRMAAIDRSPAAASGIERERDGLFYLNGEVNGTAVRFLVDTGASIVVLTPGDAERIGVAVGSRSTALRIETVSGSAAMRWAKLERVRIGGREVRNLDAAIVADGLKVSLLGQNALTQLGSVTIAGNRLHLN